MTQTMLTRGPGVRRVRESDCRPRPAADAGPTLDDVISRAWEVLGTGLPATCPACGGELEPRPSAGSGAAGGRGAPLS
jgi:hypothetical protein